MSNLSDLLPTGGGQNAVDFVASGTLGSGQTVVLNSNGTVSAVTGTSAVAGAGTPATFNSNNTSLANAVFDSNQNKIVVVFQDTSNGNYPTAIVGTVSGTSISFGTATVMLSAAADEISTVFEPTTNKVVSFFRRTSTDYINAMVGTVSGTSISFGSSVNVGVNSSYYPSAVYTTGGYIVVSFLTFNGGARGVSYVGTVSGTSFSYGSINVIKNSYMSWISSAYDTTNNKVVLNFKDDANSDQGTAIVGAVSGTSISYGSPVVWKNSNGEFTAIAYDPINNKIVCFCKNTAAVGTVSGTSISFGAITTVGSVGFNKVSAVWNPFAKKIVLACSINSPATPGLFYAMTISNTSVAYDSGYTYQTGTLGGSTFGVNSVAYDSSTNKVIATAILGTSSATATVLVTPYVDTNNTDFIGITAEAIADTATGPVNVFGGINEAQSGLTIGSDYYVQADGSIATTVSDVKIGQAISTTTINIRDLT